MSAVAASHQPLTVLVVDDQPAVRVALVAQLDALGHRVLEAGDASWALEQFERPKPDLVLLGMNACAASARCCGTRATGLATGRHATAAKSSR